MKKIVLFVIVGLVGVFMFILPDLPMVELMMQRNNWQIASAQVEDVTVDSIPLSVSKIRYKIFIEYTYTVNGTAYHNNDIQNIGMILPPSSTKESTKQYMLGKFPKGKVLQIHVNPQNPSQSTVPEFHSMSLTSVFIGVAMVVVSIVMIGLELLKQNRNA
ncbi:MAG: DUF3592 domain-containing protein [Candidatus Kapabacteria bacterium]|nr:DUF3592 domain-containing protein [Candidatus Kapabacteria bacterium]